MQYQPTHQYTGPAPGPNQQVIFIDQPGYYIIPKPPVKKKRAVRKRKATRTKKPATNHFKVDLQVWHLMIIFISAALIALATMVG